MWLTGLFCFYVLQRLLVLRWFAGMSVKVTAELLKEFLVPILSPLYRITESKDQADEQVKQFAAQLEEIIRNTVGHSAYYDAYNKVSRLLLSSSSFLLLAVAALFFFFFFC